jgi:SAM-dependent methyltransferase
VTVTAVPGGVYRERVTSGDIAFTGSVPELYERLLVPQIFLEPADRTAATVAALEPGDVLETAAGTGVVTRALRRRLPDAVITATDLNDTMLAEARSRDEDRSVRWQQADAQDLPFEDQSFDVVVCQFGVMFLPDRVRGYAEARRVLRPDGTFVLTVWKGLEANELARVVTDVLATAAPDAPPDFFRRTPYGHGDPDHLAADLAAAGLSGEVVDHDAVSIATAEDAAVAYVQGTPLARQIESTPGLDLRRATEVVRDALHDRYGSGPFGSPIGWLEVRARPV